MDGFGFRFYLKLVLVSGRFGFAAVLVSGSLMIRVVVGVVLAVFWVCFCLGWVVVSGLFWGGGGSDSDDGRISDRRSAFHVLLQNHELRCPKRAPERYQMIQRDPN